MVNAEMFRNTVPMRQPPQYPQPIPSQQPVNPGPYKAVDPDVEKYRKMALKWLSIIVGGAAALLLVWRVLLKFT